MYLIHFYSRNNNKMHIPESYVLKIQNQYQHSIFISEEEEEEDHSNQNCMHCNGTEPDLKTNVINNYYLYCSEF